MLTQTDLLHLAEAFAARIPRTHEYALDRNRAWRAVASGYLGVDDIEGARRVLDSIDEPCTQAQVRIEAAIWTGRHPASATGREILRDTVAATSTFQRWWSRRA